MRDVAARLHTLKGIAGTLSAKAIHRAAAQAEEACLSGQVATAQTSIQSLAHQLDQLRLAAGACLERIDSEAVSLAQEAPCASGEDAPDLAELVRLLGQSDLHAVDEFAALAPLLRRRVGHAACAKVCEQIGNLQFDDALQTLKELGL